MFVFDSIVREEEEQHLSDVCVCLWEGKQFSVIYLLVKTCSCTSIFRITLSEATLTHASVTKEEWFVFIS